MPDEDAQPEIFAFRPPDILELAEPDRHFARGIGGEDRIGGIGAGADRARHDILSAIARLIGSKHGGGLRGAGLKVQTGTSGCGAIA
mgnify:CR=1 FL=1